MKKFTFKLPLEVTIPDPAAYNPQSRKEEIELSVNAATAEEAKEKIQRALQCRLSDPTTERGPLERIADDMHRIRANFEVLTHMLVLKEHGMLEEHVGENREDALHELSFWYTSGIEYLNDL